jgi:hypothetical protein
MQLLLSRLAAASQVFVLAPTIPGQLTLANVHVCYRTTARNPMLAIKPLLMGVLELSSRVYLLLRAFYWATNHPGASPRTTHSHILIVQMIAAAADSTEIAAARQALLFR